MIAKPTPGPLIVRVGANGDVGIIATSQTSTGLDIGGALVAECFADIRRPLEGARAEALANATLFAAARDLLAALIMVRDADDDAIRDGLPRIPPLPRACIDAAIKACSPPRCPMT